jgi:hypothetical protein
MYRKRWEDYIVTEDNMASYTLRMKSKRRPK